MIAKFNVRKIFLYCFLLRLIVLALNFSSLNYFEFFWHIVLNLILLHVDI